MGTVAITRPLSAKSTTPVARRSPSLASSDMLFPASTRGAAVVNNNGATASLTLVTNGVMQVPSGPAVQSACGALTVGISPSFEYPVTYALPSPSAATPVATPLPMNVEYD